MSEKYEGGYYGRRLEFRRDEHDSWKPQTTPGPCPNHNDDQLLHDWCKGYPHYEWRIAPLGIETLTEEERALLQDMQEVDWERICQKESDALKKVLRIHDAQAARIAALEKHVEHLRGEVLELALACEDLQAKMARVQALVDDSVDPRHGPGGCGIYAYSLREALK